MSSPTEWYRESYLISTSSKLIRLSAVNEAFASDSMYWTRRMEEGLLMKMLENSLCFGVYLLPSSTAEIAGQGSPRQIGLARLVTDYVSFAYLTDVYILDDYQGEGLGTWLLKCVDETLSAWPELRRVLLLTSSSRSKGFYTDKLRMKEFGQGNDGLLAMSRTGPGSVRKD